MKRARAITNAVRGSIAFLFRPTMAGALYVLALTLLARSAPIVPDDHAGIDAEAIVHLARFAPEERRITLAIAAAAVLFGALLGIAASLLILFRDRLARRAPRSRTGFAVAALASTASLHAWLMLFAITRTPQLFAPGLYGRGGLRRTVQVLATDVLGPLGIAVVGVILLAVFLAGPREQWPRWRGRLRRAFLPHRNVWRRRASVVPMLIAIALLAAVARTSSNKGDRIANAAPSDQPNVLILAAESLRADRLTPRVAPRLSALADRGTRFERAYVSSARAFPSWVSILTGQHAHHHGIRSAFPRWDERAHDFDALPSRFARSGYRTAVVSDRAGDLFSRVDLGFGLVRAPVLDARQLVRARALGRSVPLFPALYTRLGRRAFPTLAEASAATDPDLVADDAIAAIDRLRGNPFFVTVVFSASGAPYSAPSPYYDRYTRAAYRGRFKYEGSASAGSGAAPDADDIAQIRGLYDGAVASVDDAAGKVLDALTKRGLDGHTIVIVTSDHGETLFENGRGLGHGEHLFGDEATHVPLVVFDPRRPEPRRERLIARDVDLAPTLYELTGVVAPADLDGRSLAPSLRGEALEPALAYAESDVSTGEVSSLSADLRIPTKPLAELTEVDAAHGDEIVLGRDALATSLVARHRMVKDDRWKLVYVPTRTRVLYMLFDTERDPGETRDVAADHPAELARLRGELWKWMLRDPAMIEKGGYLVGRDSPAAKVLQ